MAKYENKWDASVSNLFQHATIIVMLMLAHADEYEISVVSTIFVSVIDFAFSLIGSQKLKNDKDLIASIGTYNEKIQAGCRKPGLGICRAYTTALQHFRDFVKH